ncbi:MAG: LolA-like putative outer membrane lipoprotein chaperone [Bacteroidales bacterium]|nr:LolA-like putative outer membrane lipoprotein chaperone [Bacteroidales bacterium]
MNRIFSLFLATLLSLSAVAQNARKVLDQTASRLSKGSVTIQFSASGALGSSSGTITTQGSKFVLQSPQAHIWFDGKTEWAQAKNSNEVNVTTPTSQEIAKMNPINFLNLYKRGYNATLTDKGKVHEVRLSATQPKSSIQEMQISIDKTTQLPTSIRLRTGHNQWSTVVLHKVQQGGKKHDNFFRFNPKDHPKLEIVDLR